VRDPKLNENIELPLERWSNLAHPSRLGRYTPAQAGRPDSHVEALERLLATWANETPWAEEPVMPS
jgi:hypothetical protein